MSRPVRARGLKRFLGRQMLKKMRVAPRAGAWIETPDNTLERLRVRSRPVRARGLKLAGYGVGVSHRESRPVRARGLKLPF